ncbi:MAG: sulfate adenylyltransferase subunit 1 [Chitinophagaceae bacterium]
MDILRFITAGSVDDGKSTLIGRLLYDSKSILADQLQAIRHQTKNMANGEIDLALLTDGLRAEREQGITIDVAYKYFTTPKRKFIIADAPGHIQYTRNMVTGASTANLALILIDARNGVVEQTIRHSMIASLIGIPHIVVCVNKMDLVNYSEDRFYEIVRDFKKVALKLDLKDVYYIPVSAFLGDNIVEKSQQMPWFTGSPLLPYLEDIPIQEDVQHDLGRFPVQWVIRPQTDQYHDYRGYAGKIISGKFHQGQTITILPSGVQSKIQSIEFNESPLQEAIAPQSVILHLEDDLDISRGDLIVPSDQIPELSQDITATVCWMDHNRLQVGDKYLLQQNSALVKCVVKQIPYRVDVNTMNHLPPKETGIELNEIFQVVLKTARPLAYDPYLTNPSNGGFILINENSQVTVGAGMIG